MDFNTQFNGALASRVYLEGETATIPDRLAAAAQAGGLGDGKESIGGFNAHRRQTRR
jgi:hypothetical protein